ncbi:unnamed protein product, partial [marine sediment metagenome]
RNDGLGFVIDSYYFSVYDLGLDYLGLIFPTQLTCCVYNDTVLEFARVNGTFSAGAAGK